jgi:hypothetical protein
MATSKTPAKSSTRSSSVVPTLQKLFVGAAGLAFVMQIVQNAYYMALQMPENDNFSAYIIWFIGTMIIAFIWLVIYLSRRNRALTLSSVFDVTLVTFSAGLIMMSLSWLTSFIQLPYKMLDNMSVYVSMYQALPLIVTIPLLVIVLRRLRATKQW